MSESAIEWTERTWNPVVGCTPVSTGCLNCYAATMARRLEGMKRPGYEVRRIDHAGRDVTTLPGLQSETDRTVRIAEVRGGRAVFTGTVRCLPDRLGVPLAWKKPRMVFVNSMSDLFHEDVPFEFIDRVFAVMALCPQHTFQILTKRPGRMEQYFRSRGSDAFGGPCTRERAVNLAAMSIEDDRGREAAYFSWPLPNVWLGTSVEDQVSAKRLWQLFGCPAAVRFVSIEPMVGPVDLDAVEALCRTWRRGATLGVYLDWVIVGGESGPHARACDVGWIRSIVAQCNAAGVACFVKQLGARPFDSSKMDAVPGSRRPVTEAGLKIPEQAEQFANVLGKCLEASVVKLRDRKGGDPSEWPEDLRVREMPGDPLRLEDSAPPPAGPGEELSRGGGT